MNIDKMKRTATYVALSDLAYDYVVAELYNTCICGAPLSWTDGEMMLVPASDLAKHLESYFDSEDAEWEDLEPLIETLSKLGSTYVTMDE